MPKHRKTLKEKKLADLHRGALSETLPLTTIYSDHIPISTPTPYQPAVSPTNKYPYLMQDVVKTGITTALIVAVQIILFFLLKKQILVLPMVKY